MSQEDLARALNITFQQVQKYEKGANRVSAGRLLQIAQVLLVPIQYFYEDGPGCEQPVPEDAARLVQAMASPEIVGLIALVSGFRSPKIRRSLHDLAIAVAEELHESEPALRKG
jgi:transcriptional regulator with XRE-family HTH domain